MTAEAAAITYDATPLTNTMSVWTPTEDELRRAIRDTRQSVPYTWVSTDPTAYSKTGTAIEWRVEVEPSSGIYATNMRDYDWVFEPDEISAVASWVRQSKSRKKEQLPAFGDDLDAAILGGDE